MPLIHVVVVLVVEWSYSLARQLIHPNGGLH